MSEAYDRERQNNDSLSALSSKISALHSVTLDIYDNASSSHAVIDSTSDTFSSMGTSLRGSARRLGVMARQGDRVAVLKIAGMVIGAVLLLWYVGGWLWSLGRGGPTWRRGGRMDEEEKWAQTSQTRRKKEGGMKSRSCSRGEIEAGFASVARERCVRATPTHAQPGRVDGPRGSKENLSRGGFADIVSTTAKRNRRPGEETTCNSSLIARYLS
nr:protein transport protein sft1 [Quercus suber]